MTDRGQLVHMCTLEDWMIAKGAGTLSPGSLAEQGFVHLSSRDQVHIPANRLYRGRDDLVLLRIDESRLGAGVVWEDGDPPTADPNTGESMQFPHLYGPIPAASVVAVERYEPGDDGMFSPDH